MDMLLLTVAVVASLLVVVVVTRRLTRRRMQRREPAHVFRGQGEAVTVAELLEDAAERGEGVRLNWPAADLDEAGLVRPYVLDQFPTAILPHLFDDNEW